MRNKKVTKLIASTLTAVSLIAINPICANAEWRTDSTGKWYSKGNSWAIGWQPIDGNFYYFNNSGYLVTNSTIDGMQLDTDGKCILNNGTAQTNSASVQATKIKPYSIDTGKQYDNTSSQKFTMSGVDYSEGFTLGSNDYALFNLAGKYNNIKVNLGHVDTSWFNDVTLIVYLDGVKSKEMQLNSDDVTKSITIPVNKAKQMKLETKCSSVIGTGGVYYGFNNMIGY